MWHWMWRWWPCGNRSVANNVVGKYIYAKGNQMSMINPREVYMRVAKCVKLTRVLTSGYNTGNIKMKWVTLSHGRLWHQGHRVSHQNLVIKKFCKNYQQSARIFTPLTLISFHRISSWTVLRITWTGSHNCSDHIDCIGRNLNPSLRIQDTSSREQLRRLLQWPEPAGHKLVLWSSLGLN